LRIGRGFTSNIFQANQTEFDMGPDAVSRVRSSPFDWSVRFFRARSGSNRFRSVNKSGTIDDYFLQGERQCGIATTNARDGRQVRPVPIVSDLTIN
jgi:hypothetical protein